MAGVHLGQLSETLDEMAPLLTIREVSRLLNVHLSTLRRWEKAGILEPTRLGPRGHRRYTRSQITALLAHPSDRPSEPQEVG